MYVLIIRLVSSDWSLIMNLNNLVSIIQLVGLLRFKSHFRSDDAICSFCLKSGLHREVSFWKDYSKFGSIKTYFNYDKDKNKIHIT